MGFNLTPGERRERAREKVLWGELTRGQRGMVVGVVRPGGVSGTHARGQRCWTLMIPLLAWRLDDGPIRRCELVVRKRTTDRAVDSMMSRVKDYQVVRLRGRVAMRNALGSPQAMLDKFHGSSDDPQMLKEAARLARPVVYDDPRFGRLRFHRGYEWFTGRTSWCGRGVHLTLRGTPGKSLRRALNRAYRLFDEEELWAARARVALFRFLRVGDINQEVVWGNNRLSSRQRFELATRQRAEFDRSRRGVTELSAAESRRVSGMKLQSILVDPSGDFHFQYRHRRHGLVCTVSGRIGRRALHVDAD